MDTAWDRAYAKNVLSWRGSTNFNPLLPAGARFLELGCGNGKNLSALAQLPLEIHAIDVSPAAIDLCRSAPALRNKEIHYYLMDVRSLSFKNAFFDGAACFHVLDHLLLQDRKKAAQEIFRVLKKGGKLFFKSFGTKDFRIKKGVVVEENTLKRKNGIATHYFTEKEAVDLFSSLICKSVSADEWKVNYDGKEYLRQEIVAEFVKQT